MNLRDRTMLIRRLRALAPLLLATGLAPSQAGAEDRVARFCFNDWPPYAEMTDSGPQGISVDVLNQAAARAGFRAVFQELPWNRCLEMVRQGALDAVMDAANRAEYLQGPTSFSVYSNTIWVADDNPMLALDMAALAGSRVGLVSGYEYPGELLALFDANRMSIEYSVDDAANIRQLAFGRVEAIVGDFVGTLLYSTASALPIHPLAPAHSVDELYASFNTDQTEMHRRFDAAILEMLQDGTVDRIYRDHVGADFSEVLGQ